MQCEEAIKRRPRNQVVASNPHQQVFTDDWYRAEQGNDHVRPPIGHLTPGQYIAHESLGHQHQIDRHPQHPDQFPGFLIRAVHEPSEHVQIHHEKEC